MLRGRFLRSDGARHCKVHDLLVEIGMFMANEFGNPLDEHIGRDPTAAKRSNKVDKLVIYTYVDTILQA
jgi:hypothetical protein